MQGPDSVEELHDLRSIKSPVKSDSQAKLRPLFFLVVRERDDVVLERKNPRNDIANQDAVELLDGERHQALVTVDLDMKIEVREGAHAVLDGELKNVGHAGPSTETRMVT